MQAVTDDGRRVSVCVCAEGTYVIAALAGELEIASAPALREELFGLLRPAASRLVLDLSAVSFADTSGLAMLVGTGHRAGQLGGFLRLAAPAPAVSTVLRLTGLYGQFDIYPSVRVAIAGALPADGQPAPTAAR